MAPEGLISCRRAENIHGSLKSGQVHPFYGSSSSGVASCQTVTRNTTPFHPPPLFFLSFFFFSCPWQRSFNPRQTVRYIYFFPSAENSYKNSAFRKRRFPHPPYISYFFRVMNRHQSSSCSGDTLLRLFESRLGNKFQDDFFIAINSTGRKRICKNEE